jgi:Tfp pilus assembly PilM family ATPase
MATKVSTSVQPIGLDLSGDALRMAQVEIQEAGSRLVDSVTRNIDVRNDEQVRCALADALRQGRFEGLSLATCLPTSAVSVHHLRLEAAANRLEEAVRAEVAERIDYDIAEAEVRHLAVQAATARAGQQELIAFAARREAVTQQLRLAERQGLTVAGITALPLAVSYAFSYLGQRREERDFTFLVLHLEGNLTHLLAINGGQLCFARTMQRGVHDLLSAAAKATGQEMSALKSAQRDRMQRRGESELLNSRMSTPPQAPAAAELPLEQAGAVFEGFVEEIQSCTCYVSSSITGREVNKIVFSGPLANDYLLCQLLASRVGLPGQIGDPLAGIRVSQGEGEATAAPRLPEPELSVALGLSLFGSVVK